MDIDMLERAVEQTLAADAFAVSVLKRNRETLEAKVREHIDETLAHAGCQIGVRDTALQRRGGVGGFATDSSCELESRLKPRITSRTDAVHAQGACRPRKEQRAKPTRSLEKAAGELQRGAASNACAQKERDEFYIS